MKANIRKYQPQDKDQIIGLLRLNTPEFFARDEETDLIRYLDEEIELYYVVEADGHIVGCGGINFDENGTVGKISWDIFHPEYQGRSLGTQLIKHRIAHLKANKSIKRIIVRTSQVAHKFYEKQGFGLLEVVKGYWADGFDLYVMEYE